jgi:ElaB/YqjD/DUF883 family membrane-anchored ribosome-binding protein
MLVSPNGSGGRKDLHVGGFAAAASESAPATTLASVIDPLVDASENWVEKAREFVSTADDYVRNNPWQAIGVMALLGVTLGYLMTRRS